MSKITTVIFDMDGVLVDAREWHYEALNKALALFGVRISRADHLSAYDGLPTRKKLEMLSKEHALPRGLHNIISELKQLYTMQIVNANCRPTFTHELALSRLAAAGYKLALASNAVHESVHSMMRLTSLHDYFGLILSNEDVKKSKPDPEIYFTAMARLKSRPEECLIVEDNPHGIQAAQAAGAHVLTVRSPAEVTLDRIERAIAFCHGKEPQLVEAVL
jgi:beta-phosphoglucomutase